MGRLTPQDLIRDNLPLVSLPTVVTRINQLIADPTASAADIAALIAEDPALTTRLLKVVNSAMFSFPTRIDTISMAITILGTRQLHDLVIATAIIDNFYDLTNEVVDMKTYWRHSIASAVAARTLAEHIKAKNSERFFVAGLLHDIGKLVMYVSHPDSSRQVIELATEDELDTSKLEHAIFGFSHTEVGAELIRQWRLPESLIEPVLYHHDPIQAKDQKQETAIIHVADGIVNSMAISISADDNLPIDPIALTILELEADYLDTLRDDVTKQLDQFVQVFFSNNQQAA